MNIDHILIKTTDRLTEDTLVYRGRAGLFGFLIETDGTNNATLTLYDGLSATGKIIRKMIVPGADRYGGIEFKRGREAETGIYATISAQVSAAFWVDYGPAILSGNRSTET